MQISAMLKRSHRRYRSGFQSRRQTRWQELLILCARIGYNP